MAAVRTLVASVGHILVAVDSQYIQEVALGTGLSCKLVVDLTFCKLFESRVNDEVLCIWKKQSESVLSFTIIHFMNSMKLVILLHFISQKGLQMIL